MLLAENTLTLARAKLRVTVILVLVLGIVATGTRRVLHILPRLERAAMIQLGGHGELQRRLMVVHRLVCARTRRDRAILLLLMVDDAH